MTRPLRTNEDYTAYLERERSKKAWAKGKFAEAARLYLRALGEPRISNAEIQRTYGVDKFLIRQAPGLDTYDVIVRGKSIGRLVMRFAGSGSTRKRRYYVAPPGKGIRGREPRPYFDTHLEALLHVLGESSS